MIVDNFWKIFWVGWGSVTLVGLVAALSLFAFYIRQGDLLGAVGVTYQPGKDPFENLVLLKKDIPYVLSGGYLYQNSLPIQFQSWTWSAQAQWRSNERVREGSFALKALFEVPGGTVGMSGPAVDIKDMRSIKLSVLPDGSIADLLLTLYDKNGASLGVQSIGWYTTTSALEPTVWNDVTIPLSNFAPIGASSTVSGFSVSSKKTGVAFVDAVQLSKEEAYHERWVAPPEASGEAYNPFATSVPAQLPYTFSANPESMARWYTYFGFFGPGKSGQIEMGPSPETKSTGSMTVFRGGLGWSDYHVESVIDWGEVSVFSLLARFINDGNFASCAFSRYGESAQLYLVRKGESTFVAQTPGLAVKDFQPWENVKVGIEVRGKTVSCFIDGERVLRADLDGLAPAGSVGFETWDPNPAAAPHKLVSFIISSVPGD